MLGKKRKRTTFPKFDSFRISDSWKFISQLELNTRVIPKKAMDDYSIVKTKTVGNRANKMDKSKNVTGYSSISNEHSGILVSGKYHKHTLYGDIITSTKKPTERGGYITSNRDTSTYSIPLDPRLFGEIEHTEITDFEDIYSSDEHLLGIDKEYGGENDKHTNSGRFKETDIINNISKYYDDILVAIERYSDAKQSSVKHYSIFNNYITYCVAILCQNTSLGCVENISETFSLAAFKTPMISKWDIARGVRASLDEFGFVRRRTQIDLHNWMFSCVVTSIFGSDTEQLSEEIKKQFGLVKLIQEVLIVAARRNGKTTTLQLMVAAMLKNIPHCKVILFSQGLRNAQEALSGIMSMVSYNPVTYSMIQHPTSSQKLVLINPLDPNDGRRALCLPSSGVSNIPFLIS